MGIGVSVLLLAAGAVLTFAVNASVPNTSMDAIGIILMIAGAIGLLVSLAFAGSARRGDDRVIEVDHRHDHGHPARGY